MLHNLFKQKESTIITIGDTVIDAFIKLKEAHITCKLNHSECEICMKYGDKIPFESVEICNGVGNSANAAISFQRLGIKTAILTNVGDDQNGDDIISHFKKHGVSTHLITKEKGKKTNYHYVLWYEVDRTILIKHENFDYHIPKNLKAPKWIYLSSLGEQTLPFHKELALYVKNNPQTKLVFQPGTFQIKFGTKELQDMYSHTEIFFCNKEEAQKILETNEVNIQTLMKGIALLGPKIVVLTDGPNGAYGYDGATTYFLNPYPDPTTPKERTGAGDAFASTFTGAIILGKSIEEAFQWAGINSMSVVQDVGAQKGLLTEEKILEFLSKAPGSYLVKKI